MALIVKTYYDIQCKEFHNTVETFNTITEQGLFGNTFNQNHSNLSDNDIAFRTHEYLVRVQYTREQEALEIHSSCVKRICC